MTDNVNIKVKLSGVRLPIVVLESNKCYIYCVCVSSVSYPACNAHAPCYVVGSKSFRPDQLFKVTEIKQLCYFST